MSRPKRITPTALALFREVGSERLMRGRTNNDVARELEKLGVSLTPQYVGKCIAAEMRKLRGNIAVRMFHGEQSKIQSERS